MDEREELEQLIRRSAGLGSEADPTPEELAKIADRIRELQQILEPHIRLDRDTDPPPAPPPV